MNPPAEPSSPVVNAGETVRIAAVDMPAWASGSSTGAAPSAEAASATTELPAPASVGRSRRGPLALLGALVGVAVIGVGGVFAVTQLAGDSGNTPEEALRSFLSALEANDAIGLAESLAPGERDVVIDSGVPMVEQLKRLNVLDPGLDLKKVKGFSIKFSDFTVTAKNLRDDLAEVRVDGGRVTTSVDPKGLPLGKFVRDLAGDSLRDAAIVSNEQALASSDSVRFVTIKQDGRWYFSAGYSIAYADGANPVPPKGSGIPAVGASSPEEAVRELLSASANLNLRRLVELVDPNEMAALQDYAAMFVPDAEAAAAEVRSQYSVSFPGLEISSKQNGNTALVKIAKFGMSVDLDTTDGTKAKAVLAGDCLTITIDNETKKRCGREIPKLFEDITGEPIGDDVLDQFNSSLTQQQKGVNPDVGFVVVKRNGAWFISPLRTSFDAITKSFEKITPADLEDFQKMFTDIIQGVSETSGVTETTVVPVPVRVPVPTTAAPQG